MLFLVDEELEETGVPDCDYSIVFHPNYPQPTIKDRLREVVRRTIVFNQVKKKKNIQLTKVIAELRRKRELEKQEEERKERREKFKTDIANLITG